MAIDTAAELSTFVETVFERIVAMQKAIVPDSQAGAYASFDYPYGKLYWTNRLESVVTPRTEGVNDYTFTFPIAMRLHTGFLTQGFPGELETQIQATHVPAVMAYFWARRDLVYQAGQERIRWFRDDGFDFFTLSGLSIFDDGDEQRIRRMIGAEFRLTVQARIQIARAI